MSAAKGVRPAVACVAWANKYFPAEVLVTKEVGPDGIVGSWPVTAIDGTAAQIAARVREAVDAALPWLGGGASKGEITARVLSALGITTEAHNG